MTKPLLTVYIPTYNRAELLRSLVYELAHQAAQVGDKVEIVVSDNDSPDHTGEVVKWAQQFGPIRYHCNENNIGGGNNILQGPQKLAKGNFCWVLGDDDLVRPGALQTVVDALEAHPDLDYAFVNHAIQTGRPEGLVDAKKCTDMTHLRCRVRETRRVEKWEQIVALTDNAELFTFIGNHVLRVSCWRAYQAHAIPNHEFDSLASTYGQTLAVAQSLMGKPALYIGEPQVFVFMAGFRENNWLTFMPLLRVIRQGQLCEWLANAGMEPAMRDRYRNLWLSDISYDYWRMVLDKATPGREQFHCWEMLRRYWHYNGYWRMLTLYPMNMWIKPRLSPLTQAARKLRAVTSGSQKNVGA